MRLPWTIWRQTFLELWRLMLFAAGVLAVVISFAVSVRLTAQGKLGPLDTIKYMFLVMPPMMQFTLPFAAAFGATLAYHRMSQDNELAAAAANGVSHKMLLVPALVSGLSLAVLMSLLLDELAPRSFRRIEAMMAEDVARMVTGPIEAGQPLELGGTLVHADSVRRLGPNEEHGAFETLLLTGVFAVDIDENGRVKREASAGRAVVEFTQRALGSDDGEAVPGRPATQLAMRLVNPAIYDVEQGVQPTLQSATLYRTLPSTFDDNPKFRTTSELMQLPEHPDRLLFIDVLRRDLAYHLAEGEATRALDAALRSTGLARLTHESGRTFTIHAAGITRAKERWELIAPKGGSIEVDLPSVGGSGEPTVRLTARTGGLRSSIGKDRDTRELTVKLELEGVAGRVRAGDPAGEREMQVYSHLAPAESPLPGLLKLSSPELLAEVERRRGTGTIDPSVSAPAHELHEVLAEVGREITSKYHERWASCVNALLMILAGSLTAMRLGNSQPLVVYLWCFFPALFSVVTIATGQQVAHKVNQLGLGVLWAGVAVLVAYTLVAFGRVRRR